MCNVFVCDSFELKNVADIQDYLQKFPNQKDFLDRQILIDNISFCTKTVFTEIDLLIRLIRKNWHRLQNIVLNLNVIVTIEEAETCRNLINQYFQLILFCVKTNETVQRKYTKEIINRLEKQFVPLVKRMQDLDDEILLKLPSTIVNNEKTPFYQYLHAFFDVNYYLFKLYQIDDYQNSEVYLKRIINDLILLSWKNYRQHYETSFLCSCHKTLWLLIQFYSVQISDDFWNIFNEIVINYRNKQFVLWLLKDIAWTYSIIDQTKTNYQLIEIVIKDIINNNDNHSFLVNLRVLQSLICELWLKYAKIEIYQQLWEYFSKHLNNSNRIDFNLNTNQLTVIIDRILWSFDNNNGIDEDFEYFLGMLIKHLTEYPVHWQKIKGRIYSQLSPNKIKDLNNIGIYHILLMFICLTRINFDEAVKRFISFIECLSNKKRDDCLLHNFYAVFIIRHIRENRDIETITNAYMKLLENQDSYEIFSNFLTNFELIINTSDNLQLKQYLLINNWINKYLAKCHPQEIEQLNTIFLTTLERINQQQIWCDNWENCYKIHIYRNLKYLSSLQESPDNCGILAGKIVQTIPSLLNEAFSFFNNDIIIPTITSNFLCTILENYPNNLIITENQELIVLKSWIKICLFTKENPTNLTGNILKLECLPDFIRNELKSTQIKDPLVKFIETLHTHMEQCLKSLTINRFIKNCFNSIDNWISQYFNQTVINEAIILRIYTCIGLLFYKIGPLLYDKHKTNCCYTRLIIVLLLSNDVMTGKSLHQYNLHAIRKTWHLFFISTVNLNSSGDVYLERILKDLIVKYIPHFTITDTPILKCLDYDEIADILLEKLSNNFFKYPIKEAETNVYKSLRILNEFVDNTNKITTKSLTIIIDKTLFGLFEIIMFHNQRNTALNVVQSIIKSPFYEGIKEKFSLVIINLTEKHLAFHTNNYFQLLNVLLKFIPNDLRTLLDRIKNCIRNVEKMRGVGYDRVLREHFEKLESKLPKIP